DPNRIFLKDDRMRKAVSLALDRTTLIETFNDVAKYKSIGIDRKYRIPGWTMVYLDDFYVDPRGKDMGDAAQWFQFDVQKAKQLVSAAGYANGVDTESPYSNNNGGILSANFQPLLIEWLGAVGIRAKGIGEDYATVFNPISWHGDCNGMANQAWTGYPDPGG